MATDMALFGDETGPVICGVAEIVVARWPR